MFSREDRAALARIERKLNQLLALEIEEMARIEDVTAAVERETTVNQSAITLLTHLSELIKAAGTDPQKLDALVSSLDANSQSLADAITANTPAE